MYVVIWLFVLVLSTWMFQYASGGLSIRRPNMISISYYLAFLMMSFIGPLLIVLKIDGHYMINKITNDDYRVIGFIIVLFAMLVTPLIMVMVTRILGVNPKKAWNDYLNSPIVLLNNQSSDTFKIFSVLSVFSLLAIAYTIYYSDVIPVFELLKGQTSNLASQRIEASSEFGGNVLIRNIFAKTLTPVLSLVAYIYMVETKKKGWFLWFWILFFASFFIQLYDLAKSPIFFYLIMIVILRIYVGRLRLTLGKISLLGSLGAAAMVGLYVIFQGEFNASEYFSFNTGPIGRLILSQIAPFYLHLQVFGDSIPFLNGLSLSNFLLSFFDLQQIRSASLLMSQVFPERIENGTAGVLNTLFVAEAYANFGYLGVLVGTLYIGAFLQLVYITFLKLPKHPLFVALFVYFSINIPRALTGGFFDFIFSPIWILLSVMFGCIYLWARHKHYVFNLLKRTRLVQ